ncbi:O-acetylhomoserine aminocarboxypropyltransferase/cysteine synthase family protein [Bradyrhizobium sp. SZCCHNRI1003]|uniref:O-acetylhomoserine aminocarboxypropyltransferase/cysteine synthase family protein n=1 Tax=Bradyrhizobium sp. SZCCHNRI1003 TaxID=3057275 RepID=UPI002916F7E7|nr:O-acetylhomoserine aminocarboxypropyltransferase/cysteine synthase family protein [Bradyrhizobium sp. SZCCHNRI1003]
MLDRSDLSAIGEPLRVETSLLHHGFRTDPGTFSTIVPICLSNAYAFESIEHASDVFDLRRGGRTYSRLMNPTTDVLEERLASLEGGVSAIATSSGQAAIAMAILNIAAAGDNIVSSTHLYGGTINLLSTTFGRLGIETRFVEPTDVNAFERVTDERTRCYFAEVLPNPRLTPFPVRTVSDLARRIGLPLIVDNTMSPYICRPIDLGANIVVHSTSKYVCGHGTTIGGAIIDAGSFDWAENSCRFALMTEPDHSHGGIMWLEAAERVGGPYGRSPYLLKLRNTLMRDFGPCPSPFASFLLLQGLETLPLRMERHCENAERLARAIAGQAKVCDVSYPLLAPVSQRNQARENMGRYGGPLLQFELSGGIAAGRTFVESLRLAYHVSNIGDARTLVTHPASTTHASVSPAARAAAGVRDGTIRVSVGIEHIDDIMADFQQAFAKV